MTRKNRIGLFVVIPLFATAIVAKPAPVDPDKSTRQSSADEPKYVERTVGPKSIGMAAVGAAVNQANDTPHEWGQGMAGFGRRFASGFGKHIVHKAIQLPVAKLLHEEFAYRPSDETGFRPRLKSALLGVVITHKTTTGKRTPNIAEVSGAIGSGLISRAWQPASTASVATGFSSGGITLGIDAGMNVVKEFWPEIRHPHSHAEILEKRRSRSLRAALPDIQLQSSVELPSPEQDGVE